MIFSLKSGDKVGGYFGDQSTASSFPNSQEIYVQDVWRLDKNGRFDQKIDGTYGMLIKRDDCDLIELLREAEAEHE